MPSASKVVRADSAQTRERILDASETLFSELGYSGTSLRAIAEAAGVNVAAAHYHFGSKAQLLEAAFQRCIGPINEERLRRLTLIEEVPGPPAAEAIVRAFVEPVLERRDRPALPRLIARLFAEPKAISVPLLERAFRPVAGRFFTALARALPEVPPEDLRWRFHFMVGALLQLANFDAPLNLFGAPAAPSPRPGDAGPEQLVRFVMGGLCRDVADGGSHG